MRHDILYTAWNRLAFVEATFTWMEAHTHWPLVEKVIIYDDGSEDGTREWLQDNYDRLPVECDLRLSDLRSPPAIMNHYLATSTCDWFCKVDSDIALPPSWNAKLLQALDTAPEFEAVGMEAGMVELAGRDGKEWDHIYRVEECTHIGGVGLISGKAVKQRTFRIPERGRYGWQEFQTRRNLKRGWIRPDLHCPQLDRIPEEPWLSLRERYIDEGWSREWPLYDKKWMAPYWEWMNAAVEA